MKTRLPFALFAAAALTCLAMERPPKERPVSAPAREEAVTTSTPLALPVPLEIAADTLPFTNAPEAGGIKLESSEGEGDEQEEGSPPPLTRYTQLTLLFPEAMAAPDRIDAADSASPLNVHPDLDAEWTWRTQSQGAWSVRGPLIPGQTYRVRLAPDLANLAGVALPAAAWGYEMRTAPLAVASEYEEREQLSAQPQVPLEFNYPIRLADAAAGVWFQNRATRERFPAELLLNRAVSDIAGDVVDLADTADIPAPYGFRVRPREPLPVGITCDLVVENVFDAYAGRSLPYPRIFALGTTRPLAVDFVAARNWPTGRPHIEVKFTAPLGGEPLPPGALEIEPAVPNLALRKEGQSLLAAGDFDTSVRYRVTVAEGITGDRGYPLQKPETWGATFHPKKPTVLFPDGVLRQRTALGLRFALLQANTGPITWRLAAIPLDRLDEVRAATIDAASEILVDAFRLDVAAQGEIPASDSDREQVRTIEWKPADGQPSLSGPYLLEAVAKTAGDGSVVNRSLVFFNETVFTQKTMPSGIALRLAAMSSGEPLAGTVVRVVTPGLDEIAQGTTDQHGAVEFPTSALAGSAFFLAGTRGATAVELTAPGRAFDDTGSLYARPSPAWLGAIVTDRPLYRPGEEIRFKGMLRADNNGRLRIPAGTPLEWRITSGYRNELLAAGAATVNPFGGWDAAWTSAPRGRLGDFRISAILGGEEIGDSGVFRIEEFRNPPFSVACEAQTPAGAGVSKVDVASQYFHGAPNVGSTVKWTATWISDSDGEYYDDATGDGFLRVDLFSQNRRTPVFEMEVAGETALDARGRATLTSETPFKDAGLRARCTVLWRVDVTGPDGQTITGGTSDQAVMNDVTLGVRADGDTGAKDIAFDVQAVPRDESQPAPASVEAGLFLVETKSVKERLAPFVYRYRNTDEFIPVESRTVPANGRLAFTPKQPGRYVLVVKPLAGQPGITVSDEIYLAGEGQAQLPVRSDHALEIKSVAKDEPVPVGTNAALDVLSPSPGIAWVTVETDRILETFTIPLTGNSSRIELPVKPGYAPNVHISAYLLRPGGGSELPGEMYGSTQLSVVQPGAELELAVSTDKQEYEPRQTGKITVLATAGGQAAPNAEITLYAVDDSILSLGGWSLPTLLHTFYPDHPFNVVTRIALAGYIESIREDSLTMKESVVGEMGKDEFGNTQFVRQDFRPLILWLPSIVTGANGSATAEFTTPDNLTCFRVIVLAQTKENRFGSGDSTFTVTKPLLIEPALPRFLRQGDEIELRAIARQSISPGETLSIGCETGDGLALEGPARIERTAGKNAPAVAVFRARVANTATEAVVRFTVAGGGRTDEVEVTIPVASRTITVRESTAGPWSSGGVFDPSRLAPAAWSATPGTIDLTLSTSPWLPKLLGIPAVLDYPYGCFEQKSSRLLVHTALAKLLAFLPQPTGRDENYRRTIDDTLREFEKSLLPDDTLPYWPYGTEGNAFVTIQAAWAVAQAQQAGYEVPSRLTWALPNALRQMALRKSRLETEPTLRAFALFVLSRLKPDMDDTLVAAANELFLGRDRLTDEGRAMLAIALHSWEIEPAHQRQLLREIPDEFDLRKFQPSTFSSGTRAEAICAWARLLVTPDAQPLELQARLETLMAGSSSLSTQENLWLLIAFNALLDQRPPAALDANVSPKPDAVSANRSAAAWIERNAKNLRDLAIRNAGKSGSYVLAARRQLAPDEQAPVSKGLRIERVVKNLTAPARTGNPGAPFKLGDQILISFRFHSDEPQSFVAVEDALPAGLEVLNPNLEMIGKFYQIPDEPGAPAAWLSFAEMRDRQTNLFFDTLSAGAQSYAVLARATAVGTFAWPSTQMTPMYDSRFYARTAPSSCVVSE